VLGLAVGLQHGRRAVTVSAAYVAGGHASAEGLREPLAWGQMGADGAGSVPGATRTAESFQGAKAQGIHADPTANLG